MISPRELLSILRKYFYLVAGWNLWPAVAGAVGFAYMGSESAVQQAVREIMPPIFLIWAQHHGTSAQWSALIFVFSSVCTVWGALAAQITLHAKKIEYQKLKRDHSDLKQKQGEKFIDGYAFFSEYLSRLSLRLGLNERARVSLYVKDADHSKCIGRYSVNGRYDQPAARPERSDFGWVGVVWNRKIVVDDASPDPSQAWGDYALHHWTQYRIAESDLRSMEMQSCAIWGVRLDNYSSLKIAVLFFESIDMRGVVGLNFCDIINEHELKSMCRLIEFLKNHMPSINDARRGGF